MDNALNSSPVLVVEDELLIAMDLELMLHEIGFKDCLIKTSCAEADSWFAANRPLFAVLDIQIQDGTCEAIARHLIERGVPFVVSSGSDAVVTIRFSATEHECRSRARQNTWHTPSSDW